MSSITEVASRIDAMVKDIAEYLRQKDLAGLKKNSAFVSEITIVMMVFIEDGKSLDFIKDIEAIVEKYGFEITNYNIYPLGILHVVYIHIAFD